nr:hypothetical protein [Sneathiella glossodoripedis]
MLEEKFGRKVTSEQQQMVESAMFGLKERAKSVISLADSAAFLIAERPLTYDEKALKLLNDNSKQVLDRLADRLEKIEDWSKEKIEAVVRESAEAEDLKLGKIAQPLRAALTGTTVSPGIFDVLEVLGKENALGRIRDVNKA